MPKPKLETPLVLDQLIRLLQDLRSHGVVDAYRHVVVFGPTPGLVTDVTVGAGGNLTFIYRAMTSEEMGGQKKR